MLVPWHLGKASCTVQIRCINEACNSPAILDRAVHIGKQGLGIIAPKLNNFMGDYLAQGALSGVMHGIGAYDKAKGEFMSTHDTVMDKIRQGGEILQDLRNLQPAARPY